MADYFTREAALAEVGKQVEFIDEYESEEAMPGPAGTIGRVAKAFQGRGVEGAWGISV